VVDGGSSDDSLQVLRKFDALITTCICEPDHGIYDAMNKGWRVATGKYCLFLNAGDSLYDQDVLAKVAPFLEQHGGDYLFGDIETVAANGHTSVQKFEEPVSLHYLFRWFVPHPCSFIRIDLLRQMGGYSDNYRIISDWVFSVLAFCRGARFVHIPFVVSSFVLDGVSSTQTNQTSLEQQQAFERELAFLALDWQWFQKMRPLELSKPVQVLRRVMGWLKKMK